MFLLQIRNGLGLLPDGVTHCAANTAARLASVKLVNHLKKKHGWARLAGAGEVLPVSYAADASQQILNGACAEGQHCCSSLQSVQAA